MLMPVPPSRDSRATSSLRIEQQPATTSALVTKWVKPTNINCREALERAKDKGFSHLILDGKIIPCDRCKEPAVSVRGEVIDLWHSGKAHAHGGNVQAVLAPDGFPLWVSQVEPGSMHDITAARAHALPALYPAATAGLPARRSSSPISSTATSHEFR